jgi:hypothetical protein
MPGLGNRPMQVKTGGVLHGLPLSGYLSATCPNTKLIFCISCGNKTTRQCVGSGFGTCGAKEPGSLRVLESEVPHSYLGWNAAQ